MLILKAIVLGLIEGATEFLPVSSTGHLILASEALGFPEQSRATFEIFIQLGAILAVVWHFRMPLSESLRRAISQPAEGALLAKIGIAFLPAAIVGFLFHGAIEEHLFSPRVVAVSLLLGGLAIVAIERRRWHFDVERIEQATWSQAFWVGVAQILSLVPGVSRAGATIIGGMFAGLDRPTSTQFSFYLSIPTMTAASLYSLYKARGLIAADDVLLLLVGFVTAFVSALVVVRAFLTFVQRHDFTPFGYYRIAVGVVLLWFLG